MYIAADKRDRGVGDVMPMPKATSVTFAVVADRVLGDNTSPFVHVLENQLCCV
jgi:hypothetical protein